MIESWQPILNRCFGFEPGSQEILIISKLSECYQKTTLNREPRNACILIITPVPGSNPLPIRTKGIRAIYYQHIFEDISAPRTQINLSFALLKPCFQAGSFEYNYIGFEERLGGVYVSNRCISYETIPWNNYYVYFIKSSTK